MLKNWNVRGTGGTFEEEELSKLGVVGLPCRCSTNRIRCNCAHPFLMNDSLVDKIYSINTIEEESLQSQFLLPISTLLIMKSVVISRRSSQLYHSTKSIWPVGQWMVASVWLDTNLLKSTLYCCGKPPTPKRYHLYSFSFEYFACCSNSLVNNRQTRMIAPSW